MHAKGISFHHLLKKPDAHNFTLHSPGAMITCTNQSGMAIATHTLVSQPGRLDLAAIFIMTQPWECLCL